MVVASKGSQQLYEHCKGRIHQKLLLLWHQVAIRAADAPAAAAVAASGGGGGDGGGGGAASASDPPTSGSRDLA